MAAVYRSASSALIELDSTPLNFFKRAICESDACDLSRAFDVIINETYNLTGNHPRFACTRACKECGIASDLIAAYCSKLNFMRPPKESLLEYSPERPWDRPSLSWAPVTARIAPSPALPPAVIPEAGLYR